MNVSQDDQTAPAMPVGENPGTAFLTTRWSIVVSAQNEQTEQSREALEALCRTYWMPLYAYVRRQGHRPAEAEDFTQGFFERMLQKDFLSEVDQSKGKFRSFLLACLKHYLYDEYKFERRLKRGGGMRPLSLDWDVAEQEFADDPSTQTNPDLTFDRRWALTLLHSALKRLEQESYAGAPKKIARFEMLKPFLVGALDDEQTKVACDKLGVTRNNLQVTIHRLRGRYRELIREAITETVANPSEVDAEMRYLFNVLTAQG